MQAVAAAAGDRGYDAPAFQPMGTMHPSVGQSAPDHRKEHHERTGAVHPPARGTHSVTIVCSRDDVASVFVVPMEFVIKEKELMMTWWEPKPNTERKPDRMRVPNHP